jgi:hypothetical protein
MSTGSWSSADPSALLVYRRITAAGVERGFVTVTLPHCPTAREKHSLATVSSCLMDKNDYPSFVDEP